MAEWNPTSLAVKGALASFHQRYEQIPEWWLQHVQVTKSVTKTETYAVPGFIPRPRVMTSGRNIQGLLDFSFDVKDDTHELSILINRELWEDDQTGLINSRVREMAERWKGYKNKLFVDLLTNGNVTGSNGFDGLLFHSTTRVIGQSANIDNSLVKTGGADPTVAAFCDALETAKETMRLYENDVGDPFTEGDITRLRLVVPPQLEMRAFECLNTTFVMGDDTAGGSKANAFRGMADFDVANQLTGGTEMFINDVGHERKPFIYQERTKLEVEIFQTTREMSLNNGILVLCRQRFKFAYGEPRRSILMTFTA